MSLPTIDDRTASQVGMVLDCLTRVRNPGRHPSARRLLRYTAALLPSDLPLPRVAAVLHTAAPCANLSRHDVDSALAEDDEGVTADDLRRAADVVRGVGQFDPAWTVAMVHREHAFAKAAAWVAAVDGHTQRLEREAARRVKHGWITAGIEGTPAGLDPDAADLEEFAERHRVSVDYAARLLARAASREGTRQRVREARDRIKAG